MKNYKDVVADRFNQESEVDVKNSIYDASHPIGKYSQKYFFKGLSEFILWYKKDVGKIQNVKLLDLGCGTGGILHYFFQNGFPNKNLTGIDLSDLRIKRAQQNFPDINFICGDAVHFKLENQKFDIITAFDLYSHLATKEELNTALKNVHHHLNENGIFLWYDIYAKDHFSSSTQADSAGFSKKQMLDFAACSNFEIIYQKSFFKFFFNRYHSIYQAKRVPHGLLRLLEILLPGSPGNVMLVCRKKNNPNTDKNLPH